MAIEIVKKSMKMNCDPGTTYDAWDGDVYLGRIWKCGAYYHTSGSFGKEFRSKESAAAFLDNISDNKTRTILRKHGVWDTKTHPKRTLKSDETIKQRSWHERDYRTKTGHVVRYKKGR